MCLICINFYRDYMKTCGFKCRKKIQNYTCDVPSETRSTGAKVEISVFEIVDTKNSLIIGISVLQSKATRNFFFLNSNYVKNQNGTVSSKLDQIMLIYGMHTCVPKLRAKTKMY